MSLLSRRTATLVKGSKTSSAGGGGELTTKTAGARRRPEAVPRSSQRAKVSRLAAAWRALRNGVLAVLLGASVLAAAASFTLVSVLRTEAGQAAWERLEVRHPEAASVAASCARGVQEELTAWIEQGLLVSLAVWLALRESAKALQAWGNVGWLLAVPLASRAKQLTVWFAPYAARAALATWRFQLNLPAPILLVEATLLGLISLSVWLNRFIKRRRYVARAKRQLAAARARVSDVYGRYARWWAQLKAEVARKSRTAAALLPHITYVAAVAMLAWLMPGATRTLAGAGRDTLLYSAPLTLSVWALVEGGEEGVKARLMYWVVFGSFTAVRLLWWKLPYLSRAAHFIPFPDELLFFTALWMMLPFGGLSAVFSATLMPLRTYLGATHQFQSGSHAAAHAKAQGTLLLSQLSSLRIISERTRRAIVENLVEGASLTLGLLFLFTPSFMTRLGTVYVGYAVPVNSTLRALSVEGSATTRSFWLKFWVVQVVYTLLYDELYKVLSWVPLLPLDHISLLFLVWLQLPYFRGVEKVCSLAVSEVGVLLHSLSTCEAPSRSVSDDGDSGSAQAGVREAVHTEPPPDLGSHSKASKGGCDDTNRVLQDSTKSNINQATFTSPSSAKKSE